MNGVSSEWRYKLDFAYDSMNRRVAKDVSIFSGNSPELSSRTRFLYDGWNLIAEWSADLQSASLTKIHLWGLDISGSLQGAGGVGGLLSSSLMSGVSQSSVFFPTYDGNGNITAWLDGSGAMLDKRDYDPFGALLTQYKLTATPAILDELPFGFSTKYTDKESGLLYYGHRYYNTRNKRWLNRDLIEESGGVNLYGFVGNKPLNFVDLLGLYEVSVNAKYLRLYKYTREIGMVNKPNILVVRFNNKWTNT